MQLKFLYGQNLIDKTISIKPGTIYLDTATGELFFDNPSDETTDKHNKIIDTATLIYQVSESVTYPSTGDEDAEIPGGGALTGGTTAKLGVAVLGTMVLGAT